MEPGAKTAPRERLLDLIRGVAVCGILLMNIPYMGSTLHSAFPQVAFDWAHPNWQAFIIGSLFIEGSMRGLFTLLFGASLLLMLQRKTGDADAPGVGDMHYRRAFALILLGLLHAHLFLWYGDILYLYGLTALLLFPLRLASVGWKYGIAALLIAVMTASGVAQEIETQDTIAKATAAEAARAGGSDLSDAQEAALEHRDTIYEYYRVPAETLEEEREGRLGDFQDVWSAHAETWVEWNLSVYTVFGVMESLAFMLIGMALFGQGVLTGRPSSAFYALLAGLGYLFGVGGRVAMLALDSPDGFDPEGFSLYQPLYEVCRLAVTLGHVGLLGLIWRGGVGDVVGAGFEALGRMALTNYMTASLVCAFLFYGIGLGWFGRFTTFELWGIAGAILLVQAIVSFAWLRIFRMGPFEWVLRVATYCRLQPILKAGPDREAPAHGAPG